MILKENFFVESYKPIIKHKSVYLGLVLSHQIKFSIALVNNAKNNSPENI